MFEETSGTPTAIEESHYYAFGMRIEGLSTSTPDNKFTYNGKELEDDHGLNWYHYGARFYDPQVGRWWVGDPLDEYFSIYVYVANNPIRKVDPDGRGTGDAIIQPTTTAVDQTSVYFGPRKPDIVGEFVFNVAIPVSSGVGEIGIGWSVAMGGSETLIAIPAGVGLIAHGAWEIGRGFENLGDLGKGTNPKYPGLGEFIGQKVGGKTGQLVGGVADLTVGLSTMKPGNFSSGSKFEIASEYLGALGNFQQAGDVIKQLIPDPNRSLQPSIMNTATGINMDPRSFIQTVPADATSNQR
jgi:RHS repeat-associated protein